MLSSLFLHGIAWAVQSLQVMKAGQRIITSLLGRILLFQNLVLLLILNGNQSFHGSKTQVRNHTVPCPAMPWSQQLCASPLARPFQSWQLGKWRATQSEGVWRPDPKPFWGVHCPEAHLAHQVGKLAGKQAQASFLGECQPSWMSIHKMLWLQRFLTRPGPANVFQLSLCYVTVSPVHWIYTHALRECCGPSWNFRVGRGEREDEMNLAKGGIMNAACDLDVILYFPCWIHNYNAENTKVSPLQVNGPIQKFLPQCLL